MCLQMYNTCAYKCIYTSLCVNICIYLWMDMPCNKLKNHPWRWSAQSERGDGCWERFRRELTHVLFPNDLSVSHGLYAPAPTLGTSLPQDGIRCQWGPRLDSPGWVLPGYTAWAWTLHLPLSPCAATTWIFIPSVPQFPHHFLYEAVINTYHFFYKIAVNPCFLYKVAINTFQRCLSFRTWLTHSLVEGLLMTVN